MSELMWETVVKSPTGNTERLEVDGGHIYRSFTEGQIVAVYVPNLRLWRELFNVNLKIEDHTGLTLPDSQFDGDGHESL